MKTNKPKAQPDTGFNAFCQAMEHYATANHALHTLQLRINTDIEDLIAGYEPQLATLIQARETAYTTIQTYCQRHKKQLFGNRRSVAFRSLTVKYRQTPPHLQPLKGKSWQTITATLKERLPAYIRTTEEPDKQQLLAHRHQAHVALLLREVGLQVIQEDHFVVEAT